MVVMAYHVRAAFSAMRVQADRQDARSAADLVRLGSFKHVYVKSGCAGGSSAADLANPSFEKPEQPRTLCVPRPVLRAEDWLSDPEGVTTKESAVKLLPRGHLLM